jgi:hypothetical protein
MSRMTSAERMELGKLVRLNAKVAKADAEARGKWLLADAEAKLAAKYKFEDEAWADITAAAEKAVREADAAIAAICRERGVPEEFRPSIQIGWFSRGENRKQERRAELRKVAQATVEAQVKEAQVEIDRQAAEQQRQITQAGLTSEEARAFIEDMPKPEHLLPPLATLLLCNGQVVALEAPLDAPPVTPDGEAVTTNGNAVTANRNVCAFCGQGFSPSRRDGKYCRPACKVADWRRRLKANEPT